MTCFEIAVLAAQSLVVGVVGGVLYLAGSAWLSRHDKSPVATDGPDRPEVLRVEIAGTAAHRLSFQAGQEVHLQGQRFEVERCVTTVYGEAADDVEHLMLLVTKG